MFRRFRRRARKNRHKFRHQLATLLQRTNARQQPNINELWLQTKDLDALRWNVKQFGYWLGRNLQPQLLTIDFSGEPRRRELVSKPTTQADIESPWFAFWCNELKIAPLYHRKLWEYAFTLQALYEADLLQPGMKGIGFGCGEEPMASYFASRKMDVLVTDLEPDKVAGLGWAETGQHAGMKANAYHPDIVSEAVFDAHVQHAFVDMNAIPRLERQYDFCWSICALEHLGSIKQGLRFVERSLDVLRPGGVAIHTTEYNYLHDEHTIDNWPTVLFLRKHFEELAARVNSLGHTMRGPTFDIGRGPLDQFIDLPPYSFGGGWLQPGHTSDSGQAQLKLSIDGFPCTCYGMIIQKKP